MTREPLPELTPELQARGLIIAFVPYRDWQKRNFDRWGEAWREMYGVPIDDKPKETRR